jgi:hypothetical protein
MRSCRRVRLSHLNQSFSRFFVLEFLRTYTNQLMSKPDYRDFGPNPGVLKHQRAIRRAIAGGIKDVGAIVSLGRVYRFTEGESPRIEKASWKKRRSGRAKATEERASRNCQLPTLTINRRTGIPVFREASPGMAERAQAADRRSSKCLPTAKRPTEGSHAAIRYEICGKRFRVSARSLARIPAAACAARQ